MDSGENPIQLDPQVYGPLPFSWAVSSDIGKVRKLNEDAYRIEPETGLFVVSDGMGGHAGGEVASAFVVNDLSVTIDAGFGRLRSKGPRAIRRLIKKAIRQHNKQVRQEGETEAGYKDMGATVVLAFIYAQRVTIANVGDSRIYRCRKGRLTQLSRDHSVVGELIAQGKLQPEEAENHSADGIITQYMGMLSRVEPYVKSFSLKKDDVLLLCSDGLTDMLTDPQICNILARPSDLNIVAQELVDQANNAGGNDNITVVLIHYH